MVEVFFSYSSKDREAVRPIHDALVAEGFEVFWDQAVPAGVDWDTWIRQHLTKAKCAVVFWSKNSVASDNVRHEATVAKQQDKLVPVLLESLSASEFPMGLWTTQGANLSDYTSDPNHPEWQKLLVDIEGRLTPAWMRNAKDRLEAQLVAERARRESAERRDRTLQNQIAREAQLQQDLKRERDLALDEVARLTSRLSESAQADTGSGAQLAQALEEITSLKSQLSEARRAGTDNDAQLRKAQEEVARLEGQVADAGRAGEENASRLRREIEQLHGDNQKQRQKFTSDETRLREELASLRSASGQSVPAAGVEPQSIPSIGFAIFPGWTDEASPWSFIPRTALAVVLALVLVLAIVWTIGNPLSPGQGNLADGLSRLSATDWASTLIRVLSGFALGTVVALLLAQLGRRDGPLREGFEVLRKIIRWTPLMAVAMVFAYGYGTIHTFIAFAALAVVLQSVRPDGPLYGATWTGLRAALQASVSWCVVGEIFLSKEGLGHAIYAGTMINFQIAASLAAAGALVVIAALLDQMMTLAQRRFERRPTAMAMPPRA